MPARSRAARCSASSTPTGLTLTDRDGSLKEELPPISQFLNRLLALTIDLQNTVFEAFEALLEAKIEGAIASGTYDVGVETITAASLRIAERRAIYTHPGTGAETQVFSIARRDRNEPLALGDALDQGGKARLPAAPQWQVASGGCSGPGAQRHARRRPHRTPCAAPPPS